MGEMGTMVISPHTTISFTVSVALNVSPCFCWVATVGLVTVVPLFSGMDMRSAAAGSAKALTDVAAKTVFAGVALILVSVISNTSYPLVSRAKKERGSPVQAISERTSCLQERPLRASLERGHRLLEQFPPAWPVLLRRLPP